MWLIALQRIIIDVVLHILWFPLWWVTGNVWLTLRWLSDMIRTGNDQLAPGLWLANLFVPMFGQTDWQGRIMSVAMRFVNVIVRAVLLVIWVIVSIAMSLFWLLIPVWLWMFTFWSWPVL